LNSVFQQLYNVAEIRDFFLSHTFPCCSELKACHVVFTQLEYSNRKYVDMREFAASWTGWDHRPINPRDQQDANEFLMLLFRRLDSCQDFPQVFQGTTKATLKNDQEGFRLELGSDDAFTSLPLVVQDQECISDSLKLLSMAEQMHDYRPEGWPRTIDVERVNEITKLPPYLILQLKRFEYSVETGQRTKIDQRYEFEDEIDFAGYVSRQIAETRYHLVGVIVHQGEANVGHYFSYVKHEDNNWLCLNDIGVNVVSTSEMRANSYGEISGSSAYLLFYQRDDAGTFPIRSPINEIDAELRESIDNDNSQLLIESIYFSSLFADFMLQISVDYRFGKTSLDYLQKVLVRSRLAPECRNFDAKLAECQDVLQEFLSNNVPFIAQTMAKCTFRPIRIEFSELVASALAKSPPDNGIMLPYLADFQCGDYEMVLKNWRHSFDYFKIMYDFMKLGDEYVSQFREYGGPGHLLLFITNQIPSFLANKANSVTLDLFGRRVDLSYILKILKLCRADCDELFDGPALKMLVKSEHHAKAFIELYVDRTGDKGRKLATILDKNVIRPSESMFVELLALEQFALPHAWQQRLFTESNEQQLLVQAIDDYCASNPSFLNRLLVHHNGLWVHWLILSPFQEIRIEAIRVTRRYLSSVENFGQKLGRHIPEAVYMSSTLSLGAEIRTTIVPISGFRAIELIDLLIEISPNCPQDYSTRIELAHEALAALKQQVKGRRGEHIYALAELVCVIVQHGGAVKVEIWQGIGCALGDMTLDYPLLDGKMRSYMLAVNRLSQFRFDDRISKYMMSLVGCALLVDDDKFPTARSLVVQMVLGLPERYAERSSVLRILLAELPKYDVVDWRLLAQVIAPCAAVADLMAQAGPNLVKNLKVFKHFMQALSHVRPCDAWYDGAFAVVSALIRGSSGELRVLLDQSPVLLLPFFDAACDKSVANRTRVLALRALQEAVLAAPEQVNQVYGTRVVARAFDGAEIDEFVALLFGKFYMHQKKCAAEFVAVMSSANALDERPLTLAELGSVLKRQICEFVGVVRDSGVLKIILQCRTSPAVDVEPLCTLAERVIAAGCTSEDRRAFRELAEREPRNALHAHILQLLSTNYP
jgi:hypothetical protein